MEAIYKTSWGRYIDLSRINSVSEIQQAAIQSMSMFSIEMQLSEKPIIILWEENGSTIDILFRKQSGNWITFLITLHKEIIDAWTKFKKENAA